MTAGEERWIPIGRVGRPHGLAGAFVVEGASDDPERLAPGARVYAARVPAQVVERKTAGGRPVIRLDRPVTRGTALELPERELPPLADDEFYAFQLEGLAAIDEDGHVLGTVVSLDPGVANDVLVLDTGVALPFVEDCILEIDLDAARIVVSRAMTRSD